MKKTILSLMSLAAVLLTASCSSDESAVPSADKGETVEVTFNVSVPVAASTRATGDGSKVNYVKCCLYSVSDNGNGKEYNQISSQEKTLQLTEGTSSDGSKEKTAKYQAKLINGIKYHVVCFAYAAKDDSNTEGLAYDVSDIENIEYAPWANPTANLDEYDCFVESIDLPDTNYSNSEYMDLMLTRPLAQINICGSESDYEPLSSYNTLSSITIDNVYKAFNALKKEVVGESSSMTFAESAVLGDYMSIKDVDYSYVNLGMVYVFPGESTTANHNVTFKYSCKKDDGTVVTDGTKTFDNVPAQFNFRTIIYGDLLTSTTAFKVRVDTRFSNQNIDKKIE